MDSTRFWSQKENIEQIYTGKRNNPANERAMRQIASMGIPPGARVLDIGSGPGTLAIPLAKAGCAVTALEPSEAMRDALRRRLEDAGLEGMQVVAKRWEDIAPGDLDPPYDAVIASFSLSIPDIRPALRTMHDVCRGTVYLFWFLTPPVWARVMHDLWPKIHGSPHYYEPFADILYMILLQMGIYARMDPYAGHNTAHYATIGDAVQDFSARMNCTTNAQERAIRQYMRANLSPGENGFVIKGRSMDAKIWWEAGGA
ncbi:MAG: class I SAM-dependent methyltransferase [Methanomicrobiaceae archaeon]|nr:class I SAM-dependent methyltransferase [Methanomicrobiaceae archaeon]